VNDDLILRVDAQTFADDTFKIADPSGLVIDAQLPGWAELRWHRDLQRRCGAELKWKIVRRHWGDLDHDLRRAIVKDIREALIIIVDPSLYRFEIERLVERAVNQPRRSWPQPFHEWFDGEAAHYEVESILDDSPAARVGEFLANDGLDLLETPDGLGPRDRIASRQSALAALETALGSVHNVRLFGARSGAAFAHVLDRQVWIDHLTAVMADMRYISPQQLLGGVLAIGERIQRVFDEGNRTSIDAIADLKDLVRERLVNDGHIVLPADGAPAGVIEMSSRETALLQAADIAAGYARTIYADIGLRAVCEEFKGVILNGSMVRDWSQVERPNSADLRIRR
jgi:hypothetical protein